MLSVMVNKPSLSTMMTNGTDAGRCNHFVSVWPQMYFHNAIMYLVKHWVDHISLLANLHTVLGYLTTSLGIRNELIGYIAEILISLTISCLSFVEFCIIAADCMLHLNVIDCVRVS